MKVFIKEKELEKIVLEYLVRIRTIEEMACELLKGQVENLTTRILLTINQNIKNKDNSKSYESLYYFFEDSMAIYESYRELYKEKSHLFHNEVVKDIFEGILEMNGQAIGELEILEDNPITYERMVMINSGILKIKECYRKKLEEVHQECHLGNHITKTGLLSFMDNFVFDYYKESLDEMLALVQTLLTQLKSNDEAEIYKNFLREQKIRLENMVVVSNQGIIDSSQSEDEKQVVIELTNILTRLYNMTIAKIEKLEKIEKVNVPVSTIINETIIKEIIENNVLSHSDGASILLSIVEENFQTSVDELSIKVMDDLERLTQHTMTYLRKESTPYQLLSCQILEIFENTVEALSVLSIEYRTLEGEQIGKGILDTMHLKHESLKEKDTEYQIKKKDVTIIEEKKLLDIRNEFTSQVEEILKEAIDGSNEGFLMIQERYNKKVESIKEHHFKQDMMYLRNDLCFELRTYDEIMNHSIEKLINYEGDHVVEMVNVMKQTQERIYGALTKMGVHIIKPVPGDKFDGKEHEIILAESSIDYDKGSIIKCQNVGYAIKEQVILRAGVLAAK